MPLGNANVTSSAGQLTVSRTRLMDLTGVKLADLYVSLAHGSKRGFFELFDLQLAVLHCSLEDGSAAFPLG